MRMPRLTIVCVIIAALTLAAFAPVASAADAKRKPNILFIFADDLSYDTVHATGNSEIQTPNLDRLCTSGVTFTHAYNQGGWHGAVCVASRTMLNTGRFLWHARDEEKSLKKEWQAKGKLWAQLLASAGYETYMTGKWHIQADANQAFDVAQHIRAGMPKQTKEGYNRPIEGQPDKWSPYDESFGGFWEGGKHWSEVVRDDVTGFIDRAAKSDKPFFMYVAFNAAHDPRQAPKEYVDRYPLQSISLPQPFYPEYPFDIGANRIRDEVLAPFPRTEYSVKVNRQEYYALITHMDAQIGQIIAALNRSGMADNTYIFFTADHGLACGHHGLMGKQNMFDHSVRVPFMLAGPGIPKDKRFDTRIYFQDAMATTLELAGVTKPEHVEFKSVLPIVRGEREQSYDAIYGAYVDSQRQVTEGDFKLIVYPKINKTLLFNLKDDPQEITDLSEQPKYTAKVAQLMATLKRLQKEMGDDLDLSKVAVR